MANEIFTLVGKITMDGIQDAQKQLSGLQSSIENNAATFKKVGGIMTGVGASITAMMGASVNAAAEEEQGVIKLSQALANVGVSYDDVKDSLEATIAATQTKTAIADDQQREALQKLVEITGDYDTALSLLPLTLDMATAKSMDMGSAAEVIGKVAQGNTGILSRYGVVLQDGATATEALGALQAKFAGQAEAYGQSTAGAMANVKNSMGDLMETIGSALTPIITDLLQKYIIPTIEKIKEWAEAHPELAKTITVIVSVVGVLCTALGPLIMMLPAITSALPILGAAFAALTGPVGLVVAAIAAVIAIGVLIVKNWDNICDAAKNIWGNIVDFFSGIPEKIGAAFARVKDFMLAPFNLAIRGIETAINWIIRQLNKIHISIPDWVPQLGGKTFGFNISEIELPSFQTGGIAMQPMIASVAESGPEAIVPLSRLGGGGSRVTVNVDVKGSVISERDLSSAIREQILIIKSRNYTAGLA